MVNVTVPYAALYDAGQVRLAELGAALLALEAEALPTHELEYAICDLQLGLQALHVEPSAGKREVLAGYLNEVYGLLSVGVDPLLRASLPLIPATGSVLRYRVRGQNGKARLYNNSFLVARDARLVPAE